MRTESLRKLLFQSVRSEALVKEFLRHTADPYCRDRKNFSEFDHQAVQFTLNLLKQLNDESIKLKLQKIVDENIIPNALSTSDIIKVARNKKWTKYEAGFFACGFIVSEQIREGCIDLLYPNRVPPMFSIGYFPILETVLEIENLLLKSGLYPRSHRTLHYDTESSLAVLAWLKSMELPLPAGLEEKSRQFHGETKIEKANPVDQSEVLNPKERTSMLVLIHAMAKAKFQYVEGESPGRAKNRIHQAILDANLNMSERTIGEYLKKAQTEADALREKRQ